MWMSECFVRVWLMNNKIVCKISNWRRRYFYHQAKIRIAEKLMELGNVVGGTLFFGQFLTPHDAQPLIACMGIFLLFFLYSYAIILMKEGK